MAVEALTFFRLRGLYLPCGPFLPPNHPKSDSPTGPVFSDAGCFLSHLASLGPKRHRLPHAQPHSPWSPTSHRTRAPDASYQEDSGTANWEPATWKGTTRDDIVPMEALTILVESSQCVRTVIVVLTTQLMLSPTMDT